MRINAILNKDSGSLKTVDMDAFCNHLQSSFEANGYEIDIQKVSSSSLISSLETAGQSAECDILLCCGGDGTASATAEICYNQDKIFGLIPGGTMNLYARTLGIPLDVFEAVDALANAEIYACDIATANDKPFIHQFSLGLQPEVIKRRDNLEHNSQSGKMLSSVKATISVVTDEPQVYSVKIGNEGDKEFQNVSLLTVSNNPYAKDQLPYAKSPDTGQLGIYWADILSRYDLTVLVTDVLSGNWNHNPNLKRLTGQMVTIEFQDSENLEASLDGELIKLQPEIAFKIHEKAMKCLKPKFDT